MASLPSCVSTAPVCLVSPANFLRVHLILLSKPLMKILNSTGPGTESSGIPLVTTPVWTLSHWPLPSGCEHAYGQCSLHFWRERRDRIAMVFLWVYFPPSGRELYLCTRQGWIIHLWHAAGSNTMPKIWVHAFVVVCVWVHVYTCVCACLYAYRCLYICVGTHTHTCLLVLIVS